MDPAQLSDDQLDDLADKLAPRLPTGTHGDRVILSRRQFAAAATGTLGAGALMALGVDPASAQAAGQVGTASEPVDAYAYDLNVANAVTSSLPMNGNDIENAGAVSKDESIVGQVTQLASDGTVVGDNNPNVLFSGTSEGTNAGLVIITGDRKGANVSFTDLISVSREDIQTINQHGKNSPGARSYSFSNSDFEIAIDDSADEYRVKATYFR